MGKSTNLKSLLTPGAQIYQIDHETRRLEIPAGSGDSYRLAQLDDYKSLNRSAFPWKPPFTLDIRARASSHHIPGTWGFGLWNDPFSLSLGFGGGTHRIPALPNAAWYFFASPPNHLALQNDLPGVGELAATFQSRDLPVPIMMTGALALPLLLIPPIARLLRRLGTRIVQQDAKECPLDVTKWNSYHIAWADDQVSFRINGEPLYSTTISPYPPLGLVIWVDNQYMSLPPTGRSSYGTLPNLNPSWIEIRNIYINGKELTID